MSVNIKVTDATFKLIKEYSGMMNNIENHSLTTIEEKAMQIASRMVGAVEFADDEQDGE